MVDTGSILGVIRNRRCRFLHFRLRGDTQETHAGVACEGQKYGMRVWHGEGQALALRNGKKVKICLEKRNTSMLSVSAVLG